MLLSQKTNEESEMCRLWSENNLEGGRERIIKKNSNRFSSFDPRRSSLFAGERSPQCEHEIFNDHGKKSVLMISLLFASEFISRIVVKLIRMHSNLVCALCAYHAHVKNHSLTLHEPSDWHSSHSPPTHTILTSVWNGKYLKCSFSLKRY